MRRAQITQTEIDTVAGIDRLITTTGHWPATDF
jgi:hypothetical protein